MDSYCCFVNEKTGLFTVCNTLDEFMACLYTKRILRVSIIEGFASDILVKKSCKSCEVYITTKYREWVACEYAVYRYRRYGFTGYTPGGQFGRQPESLIVNK